MKVVLSVVLFNYLDRPIFDVFVDGKMGFGSDACPATGGVMVTGVAFELVPKKVSWRLDGPAGTPRSGETVFNKNPVRARCCLAESPISRRAHLSGRNHRTDHIGQPAGQDQTRSRHG